MYQSISLFLLRWVIVCARVLFAATELLYWHQKIGPWLQRETEPNSIRFDSIELNFNENQNKTPKPA